MLSWQIPLIMENPALQIHVPSPLSWAFEEHVTLCTQIPLLSENPELQTHTEPLNAEFYGHVCVVFGDKGVVTFETEGKMHCPLE